MSADIEVNDVVQLGSNKPAWWGFQEGHLWEGLLSPMRCFAEGTGAREMFEMPVMTPDGLPLDGYKAIVGQYSNGNRTALSVVGEDYGLITDEQFFTILEGVYEGRAVVETAGTLRNGRRIWCLVKRSSYDVVTADKVQTYDLWVNRHDGSGCWELHRTNVRVVCQNTWNLAIGNGRNRVFGVRHTVNVSDYISGALRLLSMVDNAEKVEAAKLRRMAATPMRYAEAATTFDTLLGIDRSKPADTLSSRLTNQADKLLELFESGTGNKGQTRFDAFNAVTEYTDHHRSIRLTAGRSASEARFEAALLGTGDAFKARAFDLLAVN